MLHAASPAGGPAPGSYAEMLARQRIERRERLARAAIKQGGEKPKTVDWTRGAPVLPTEILVYPAGVFAVDIDRPTTTIVPSRLREIQNLVCTRLRIKRVDLLSARRHRPLVMARQIAMYLCKTCTSHSYPEIGRRFGDRDHTTVLHAVRRVAKIMATPRGTTISVTWSPSAFDEVRSFINLAEAEIDRWNEEPIGRCRNPGFKATIG